MKEKLQWLTTKSMQNRKGFMIFHQEKLCFFDMVKQKIYVIVQ